MVMDEVKLELKVKVMPFQTKTPSVKLVNNVANTMQMMMISDLNSDR
jgi:hypothetical protein